MLFLPILLLLCLAAAGLSSPVAQERLDRSVQKRHDLADSQALLVLVTQQATMINRLHDDLKDYGDQLQHHLASHQQDQGQGGDLDTFKNQIQEERSTYKTRLDSKLLSMQQQTDAKLKSMQQEVDAALDLFKVEVGFMTKVKSAHTRRNDAILKFDSVQYNEGGAYSAGTGIFTAPVAGMYTFFIKTEVPRGRHLRMGVMKEGNRVLYTYGSDANSFQTPSGQVVLHLGRGERVWVETLSGDTNTVSTWTRFGGFLVHPDV